MYNPFSIADRIILVTGASSGIGRSTAIECSRMGAKLVITGRNEVRLQETLKALEGEVPALYGLVNNAGVTETLPTQFIKREKLEKVLEINTIAPILLTQKLLKNKKITTGGSIVFTCSISGTHIGVYGNVLYSTSKGAINAFVKNAALDLSQKRIRVNEVCPGMIDTRILDGSSITPDFLTAEMARYPFKRFGKPEEVAYGIIYLLSDASSFVTGTGIVIDGGFTLQ